MRAQLRIRLVVPSGGNSAHSASGTKKPRFGRSRSQRGSSVPSAFLLSERCSSSSGAICRSSAASTSGVRSSTESSSFYARGFEGVVPLAVNLGGFEGVVPLAVN